jgi:hypothetical protein
MNATTKNNENNLNEDIKQKELKIYQFLINSLNNYHQVYIIIIYIHIILCIIF